ncbi:flagellin [Halospina sp. K52047b]|uniref:flagellin N-terminal helical domain-containing protein n=1 Tax=Halospina sp. K52047b TaxID=2614160 RepID=UPI00124A5EE2|nr:flagellin [Halospina sp. K52047b]KAA8977095.1 flagellin [Halospina sp. K52047b]
MSQIINSNIPSLQTQRNLERSQDQYQQALERLSSGLRINGSGDDPSGIAVSTRFQSQIQGLNQAVRNANDGISLAQTAEGALGSMSESLQRIRELALQSANATNTAQDREALNQEVQQLKAEISRISEDTDFNGTKLLDGSFAQTFFQIGANDGETIDLGLVGSTLDNLGSAPDDGLTSTATDAEMDKGDLRINGTVIDAPAARNDDTSYAKQSQSAIARAAAVNDQTRFTGVSAQANATTLAGTDMTAINYEDLPADNVSLNLNGVSLTINGTNNAPPGETVEQALSRITETINGKTENTGVEASFSGDLEDGIQLVAEDGRNITLDFGSNTGISDGTASGNTINNDDLSARLGLQATDGDSETFRGTYTLISEDGSDIQLDSDGDISDAGFQQGTYSGTNSGASSEIVSDKPIRNNNGNIDLILNGVKIRGSEADDDTASPEDTGRNTSAIAKAAAINAHSEETGVTASANPTVLTGDNLAGQSDNGNDANGSFEINGTSIDVSFEGDATVEERQKAIVGAVNARSGTTGVRAEAFTNSNDEPRFRLIAEDGRNVAVSDFDVPNYSEGDFGFGDKADNTGVGSGQIQRSSIALESAGSIQIETDGDPSRAGFDIGTYGNDEESQLMRYVDISTTEGANEAIVAVDNALAQVNSQRAELGATQNRFESAISNQRTATNNLESANSRIVDADFAKESSELSRAQVLQQAGLSILSQANQQPQQVLQLLQG